MLENDKGKRFLIAGGLLVVLGAVLAFGMVLEFVPTSFVTAFLTYAASVGGLLMGVTGAALICAGRKKDQ